MMRGTFANIRIRNELVPGVEGGWTPHLPDGEQMTMYDAAMAYQAEGVPVIILAGREYGTGSSRDWAAKGPALLGVRAVIAQSFERIHRSNLVGMGILPLEFVDGETADTLGLTGRERYSILLPEDVEPGLRIQVEAAADTGETRGFSVTVRLDSPMEIEYYRNGGILHTVLRRILREG
jgi:aconitate hydratase